MTSQLVTDNMEITNKVQNTNASHESNKLVAQITEESGDTYDVPVGHLADLGSDEENDKQILGYAKAFIFGKKVEQNKLDGKTLS